MTTYVVMASNEMNEGWLMFLLGLPRPEEEMAAEGWDTAAETSAVALVRRVFASQPRLPNPQYRVEVRP